MKKLPLLLLLLVFSTAYAKTETAIFAGGCFWSMQHDFANVKGIVKTTVGYTGGNLPNPSYEQVSTGTTGHVESIKILFDPAVISYPELLQVYWHDIDPTDSGGAFCDRGNEYHSVIFYGNEKQKQQAEESKQALSSRFSHIATEILPAGTFYPAEEYHQSYSIKNPFMYLRYREECHRDQTLNSVWGK